jgi:hypothetical protein
VGGVKAEGQIEKDRPEEDEDCSHTFAWSRARAAKKQCSLPNPKSLANAQPEL